uniref:(northern house mosquito) hypothetical protein n=1 Tax=Culex pipiens TaxID=7175 RepID=A0A8D8BL73_CULPI
MAMLPPLEVLQRVACKAENQPSLADLSEFPKIFIFDGTCLTSAENRTTIWKPVPTWPLNAGRQLCKLVGSIRGDSVNDDGEIMDHGPNLLQHLKETWNF